MRSLLLSALVLPVFGCGDKDDTGGTAADDTAETETAVNTDPTVFPDADEYAAVLQAASWGSNVTLSVSGETLTITSDGVPNHSTLDAYALKDGGTTGVTSYDMEVQIPLNPVYSDTTTDTSLDAIGATISGAVIFNPYEGDGTTVALDDNFEVDGIPFIDSCNGHPLPDGIAYHYHGIPYCITDVHDTAGEHSVLIGVLLDGFPVYGPNDVSGELPTDLDDCSGHTGPTPEFSEGIYHYHFTQDAPYSFGCYHGEI